MVSATGVVMVCPGATFYRQHVLLPASLLAMMQQIWLSVF
jgi:hypothetical protein